MGLGGCYTCIKYLMFTFNLLFWILGCAILGVGIWIRVDPNFSESVTVASSENLYAGSYLLIGVGAVIMVLGFLGCCGAIKESQCMLATFFVFLFIIFAVLLAAGIWAATNQSKVEKELEDGFKRSIAKVDAGDEEMKKTLQAFQKTNDCCGGAGPTDWKTTLDTCEISTRITGPGCVGKMKEDIEGNLLIITGVGIGIGVVMIFGMIFALMLCCAIRDTKA